jgi:hypothetical protein
MKLHKNLRGFRDVNVANSKVAPGGFAHYLANFRADFCALVLSGDSGSLGRARVAGEVHSRWSSEGIDRIFNLVCGGALLGLVEQPEKAFRIFDDPSGKNFPICVQQAA